MVTQNVKTWDLLQAHPLAKELDITTRFALLCEYVDLYNELKGMSLGDFVTAYFASEDGEGVVAPVEAPAPPPADTKPKRTRSKKTEPKVEPPAAEVAPEPSPNGDAAEPEIEGDGEERPPSMVGLKVVYRFPGRNVLSDDTGVITDAGGVVAFTDVDGEPWTKIGRERVFPINPDNYYEIHIIPREARDFEGWLAGTPSPDYPEGALLRSMTVEFAEIPEKITLAIINAKRPFVDRFVSLPNNGFEDDQKPTTRLFGEHCFRVRGKDYVVNVVTP